MWTSIIQQSDLIKKHKETIEERERKMQKLRDKLKLKAGLE